MEKVRKKLRKIRLKRKDQEQGLHHSLDTYFSNLRDASVITKVPDSNTIVLHLPKHVKEIVFIDRKQLDEFISNITKLITRVTKITEFLTTLAFKEDEDDAE